MSRMQNLLQTNPEKSRRPYWAVAALVLVLAAFALYPASDAGHVMAQSQLNIGTVKRGPIVRDVKAPGRFVPITETWLTARVEARVKTKFIEPGAAVSPDTVILELSAPELVQDYKRAVLDVNVAEARMRATAAQQKNKLLRQQADVELIDIEKDLAIQEAAAQKILVDKRIITGFEYQASLLNVERLKTELRINQQQLDDLPYLQQSLLSVDEAEVAQLQLRVDLLKDQVDSLQVRAGIIGILQRLPLEEGQRVIRGAELARVANQEALKVELSVQEAQAKDLALGQTVIIDTRRSKQQGFISRIDPGVNNGTVLVDVSFRGQLPNEARPDLRVDGIIEIERLPDVLFIPKPMMWRASPSAKLYRLADNKRAIKTQVRYGIYSVANVQLLDGLQEGDRIILSDVSAANGADEITLN